MRDLIATIIVIAAVTACATPKNRGCEDLRSRVERDLRTDKIVSVEVLCDGRVIPQQVGSVPAEVRHGE